MVHAVHAAQVDMSVESSSQKKDPKEFWLVAKIQDCKVTTVQETASAKCFLKIHWQDDDFPEKIRAEKLLPEAASREDMKLEKMAVGLENGDLVYGMLDAAPDSFPINIDSIFLNQISSNRIGGLCWTKYDKDSGVVSVSGCAVEPIPCRATGYIEPRGYIEPIPTFCAL